MNLLFLIRQEDLAPEPARFAELAQQEVTRVAEITQQTLRFYRQSTLPVEANIRELIDSVLTLHNGRIQSLQVDLRRDYPDDLVLFCLAGVIVAGDRTNEIFIENGRFHGRQIAEDLKLKLPSPASELTRV